MKTYYEQNYTHSQPVIVTFYKNGFVDMQFIDAVKGLNKGHALFLAAKNWEGATIKPTIEKLLKKAEQTW